MTRALLALCCLALGSCSAPGKEAAIQTALDAGAAARLAEQEACKVALADPSLKRELGFDEYCQAILRCSP